MPTYLTREGLEKLQAEHKSLMRQKLEVTEEVSKAAAHGDLRENAEYHAARERLQHISSRLSELDGKLHDVALVDDLDIKEDEIRVGARVTLEEEQSGEQIIYVLTGPDEADPREGKLSIASPLAKAMLGKKKGDKFLLRLQRSMVPYKVLDVSRG